MGRILDTTFRLSFANADSILCPHSRSHTTCVAGNQQKIVGLAHWCICAGRVSSTIPVHRCCIMTFDLIYLDWAESFGVHSSSISFAPHAIRGYYGNITSKFTQLFDSVETRLTLLPLIVRLVTSLCYLSQHLRLSPFQAYHSLSLPMLSSRRPLSPKPLSVSH